MIRTGPITALLLAACLPACLSLAGCGELFNTQAHIAGAKRDMAQGDYRGALIELDDVLRWSPHNVPALLLSTEVALDLGNTATAGEQLDAAAAHGAPAQSVAALRVKVLLAQGKARDVLQETDHGPLPEPARSIARGAAFTLLGENAKAEEAFRAALQADSSSSEARTRLAETLAREGKLDEAQKELDTVLARDPTYARAWRARAAILGTQARYPQMEHALLTALTYAPRQMTVPQQAMLLDALAETHIRLGDLAGARAVRKRLMALVPDAPIVDLVSGQLAMAQQRYELAATDLQRVVDATPQLRRAHLLLAQALMDAGDLARAESELRSMLQDTPNDADARKLLARVRLRNGWPDGAEEALQPLETAGSTDPETDALLSEAEMQQGDQSAAVATLQRAAASGRGGEQIQLLLAGAYLQTNAPAKAFATLQKLTAAHPKDVALLNRIAAMLIAHGELKRADVTLSQALSIDPTDRATQLAQAKLALRRRDYAEARKRLEALRQADPGAVQARLLLVQLDLQEKRSDEAEQVFKELQAAAAGKATLLSRIGHLYLQSGHGQQALKEFEAAAALAPEDPTSWVDVAAAQLALGHPDRATQAGEKALKLSPISVPALRVLALADLREHHPDAALERVENARDLRPSNVALLELEGDVRAARGEYVEAAASYDQARMNGGSAELAVKSFDTRQAAGLPDPEQALETWVAQHPGDVASQLALAQAYQETGRTTDAIHAYEGLVARGVADALVLNNLAWLYEKTGNPKALATARKAYELDSGSPQIADTYGRALVKAGLTRQGRRILESIARPPSAAGVQLRP